MVVELSYSEVTKLIATGVEIGFNRALQEMGVGSRLISQSEAYRRFKKSRVKHWVNEGKVRPERNEGLGKNSTIYYDINKLLVLDNGEKIIINKRIIL